MLAGKPFLRKAPMQYGLAWLHFPGGCPTTHRLPAMRAGRPGALVGREYLLLRALRERRS